MQGAIRHYSGHHEQAESYLAAAAELRPWDAEIFFLRGRNFSEVRAWRRAEECYLESQRLDPNNAALLFNLSKVYTRAGLPDEARAQLWKALEINPRFELAAKELYKLETTSRGR